jgi:hypothetical protein
MNQRDLEYVCELACERSTEKHPPQSDRIANLALLYAFGPTSNIAYAPGQAAIVEAAFRAISSATPDKQNDQPHNTYTVLRAEFTKLKQEHGPITSRERAQIRKLLSKGRELQEFSEPVDMFDTMTIAEIHFESRYLVRVARRAFRRYVRPT